MAYRSWLTDAKSIHDLGNHFYIPTAGKPWDYDRDDKAMANWIKAGPPIPVADEFKTYFGSGMHDSGFEGLERTPQILRVKLDSNQAPDFSSAMARVLSVQEVDRSWPVDLLLHDPVCVRTVRYGPRGSLQHSNPMSNSEKFENWKDEFLYDWFFEQQGRIQWIAQLWCRRRVTHKLSTDLFLLVDASHATAEDCRPQAMEATYGLGARLIWNDACQGIDTGSPAQSGIWGIRNFDDYIKRRMAARGLTSIDFNPSERRSEQPSHLPS